jgi:hypothetical protein
MAKLTGPNFNLSKTTKRLMATIANDDARHTFKHCMIGAQYAASIVPKSKKEKDVVTGLL